MAYSLWLGESTLCLKEESIRGSGSSNSDS